ncbi:ABC transporter permease [Modestobacter sp. NPDC049651]|uniref:ABC transporter permease n=1 Tax=unclassified Modestobacter TaxID=2643866 RepID=UPI0033DE064D
MGRLVQAEWTKLLTTKVWIGLLLGSCVLSAGLAALFTGLAGQDGGPGPVGTAEFEQTVLGLAGNGSILALVLGIIGITQEYRHRTATPTFLTTPRRGRVVSAKLLAYLLAGIPFALVTVAVTVLVVVVYAGARGAAPSLGGDNGEVLLGAGLSIVLYAVIGVGVGALFRNQVGAIVGSLVYLFIIENIIGGISAISGVYKWLPGGATAALTAVTEGPADLLNQWQGGLLLLAYGLVAAVLGTLLAVRRDIV